MNYLYTALAYIVGLIAVGAIASLAVLFLIGPHSGMLGDWAYVPILALGWTAVIVLPVLFARWIWRRLKTLR